MTISLLSISPNLVLLFFLLNVCLINVDSSRTHFSLTNQGLIAGVVSGKAASDVACLDRCANAHASKKRETTVIRDHEQVMMAVAGALSSALGSKPPSCVAKCGSCKPCTPVRISVPPGTPNTSEYYPEAWRCKCAGKLYMP